MHRTIIHRRLLNTLHDFYPTQCTIYTYSSENQDTTGQPDPSWVELADHINLPAAIADRGGWERKGNNMITATSTHTIALAGKFPTITAKMRAVIGDNTYDILLSEVDSHLEMTRLTCQIIV